MQDTGTLLRSVTGGTGSKSTTTVKRLVVGTNVKYARAQQFGANITVTKRMQNFVMKKFGVNFFGKSNIIIPARPFLVVDAELKSELMKSLKFHMNNIKPVGGITK